MSVTAESSLPSDSPLVDVRECYAQYYARKGEDRNNLLSNPGVLLQVLAQDAAMVRALRSTHLESGSARVLDVGCGDGSSLWPLLRLGFDPQNLHGVDLQMELIAKAASKHPLIHFEAADATRLRFEDGTFDLVMESTMLIHATNDELASRIAAEMLRVTKPGGILLVADWRYAKLRNRYYKAVTLRRISQLFRVGTVTEMHGRYRGSLLPPIGRFFSQHLPSAYFSVQTLCPVLVGHFVTVLRKKEQAQSAASFS